MITAHAISQLRAANMTALAMDYMDLRKSGGGRWKGICPFHKEKTPSFTVWSDRYCCFGCNEKGGPISFLMKIEGLRFPEAAQLLANRIGVSLDVQPVSGKQSREASNEADICRWWWGERMAEMEAVMYRAVDAALLGDEPLAESVGNVIRHYRGMTPGERFEVYQCDVTMGDRGRWRQWRAEENQFSGEWMALAAASWL